MVQAEGVERRGRPQMRLDLGEVVEVVLRRGQEIALPAEQEHLALVDLGHCDLAPRELGLDQLEHVDGIAELVREGLVGEETRLVVDAVEPPATIEELFGLGIGDRDLVCVDIHVLSGCEDRSRIATRHLSIIWCSCQYKDPYQRYGS